MRSKYHFMIMGSNSNGEIKSLFRTAIQGKNRGSTIQLISRIYIGFIIMTKIVFGTTMR